MLHLSETFELAVHHLISDTVRATHMLEGHPSDLDSNSNSGGLQASGVFWRDWLNEDGLI